MQTPFLRDQEEHKYSRDIESNQNYSKSKMLLVCSEELCMDSTLTQRKGI